MACQFLAVMGATTNSSFITMTPDLNLVTLFGAIFGAVFGAGGIKN